MIIMNSRNNNSKSKSKCKYKSKRNVKSKSNKYNIYKKSIKTRKQKGGTCYGTGVGANNYDPNYSIYNTNMLRLFPYRTS